ncbi:MAG: NfeD family protein [Christensenellaceae bacterium]
MPFWVWLILTILFVVIELLTTELVSIWLGAGALITMLITVLFPNIPNVWQCVIFIAASAVALIATRPLCKKFLRRKKDQSTNLELYIDETAVVTESIDNVLGKGAIKINGLTWSARSLNGEKIAEGELVIFKEIQGNKAIVVKKEG